MTEEEKKERKKEQRRRASAKHRKSWSSEKKKEKNEYNKAWRKNSPKGREIETRRKLKGPRKKRTTEQQRAATLKHFYGITLDDYNQMLEKQDNKCKICKEQYDHTLHVDHCHETNIIRGLLCKGCNQALGLLKDRIENLKSAISYLEVFEDMKLKHLIVLNSD